LARRTGGISILFGIAGFAEISLRMQWLAALLGT
jgi:hypothetical protein